MALGSDRTALGGWAVIAAMASMVMIGSEFAFVYGVWYSGHIQLTAFPRVLAVFGSAFFSVALGVAGMALGYQATNANFSQRTGRAWLGFTLSALSLVIVLTFSWVILDLRMKS